MTAGIRRMATEQRLWTWGGSSPTDTPGVRGVELTVGDATLAMPRRGGRRGQGPVAGLTATVRLD